MSFVRKVELLLGVLLLSAVVVLSVQVYVARSQAAKAQENYQVAAGDARAATVYVDAYKSVQKQREVKNAEVDKVLEDHRDWADAPVPDDVANLLRHPSGSTRAVP